MSLDAHAILRLSDLELPPPTEVRALTDASLVRLPVGFASEPHEIAGSIRALLGERLGHHDDARGIFVLPGAALEHAMRAGHYDAVIEQIGEAGMWIAPQAADPARAAALEALMARALDGEEVDPEAMQAAMREGLARMASAFEDDEGLEDDEGDEGDEEDDGVDETGGAPSLDLRALLSDPAMLALAEKMRDLMPPHGEGDEALDTITEATDGKSETEDDVLDDGSRTDLELPDLGALMRSPAFAEMLRSAQEILAKNPEEARKLAERFGLLGAPLATDDEE